MVTSEELNMIFSKIGNDFHFTEVSAEFAPYRDLKVRWVRSRDCANFTVSDYLQEAPVEVINGIAKAIMSRIRGEGESGYPKETTAWLTSSEFRDLNQEKYIERSRSIGEMDTDECDRLWESYDRLVDSGLISRMDGVKLFWSKSDSVAKAGQSSCLMRVVIMNRRLLDPKVPTEVLDYCLLHELANISVGFGFENLERNRMVNEISNEYLGATIAKQWLDQAMMEV